jgi:hypothetical protein
MFDQIAIQVEGSTMRGRRFLRLQEGKTYQTLFYADRIRCDPVGYVQFSNVDPVMNLAATRLIREMAQIESTEPITARAETVIGVPK